jgi:hypothetical protein
LTIMAPIDQDSRAALCRRIVERNRDACRQLAELYWTAGHLSLSVPLVRAADGDDYSMGYAVHHALTALDLPLAQCPCHNCREWRRE